MLSDKVFSPRHCRSRTAEGKLYLFVGIDRTAKFAVAQLVATADRKTVWELFQHMLEAVPFHIHTILSDNGIQFVEQPRNRNTVYARPIRFDMICEANGTEHRLTKLNLTWTNDQVERMNCTIKEVTVKRFHNDSHDQLSTHLADFLPAYDFTRRLKTLNGLTPYGYICKIWTSEPERFIPNPILQMPGLNSRKRGLGDQKGGINTKLHSDGHPIRFRITADQVSVPRERMCF